MAASSVTAWDSLSPAGPDHASRDPIGLQKMPPKERESFVNILRLLDAANVELNKVLVVTSRLNLNQRPVAA